MLWVLCLLFNHAFSEHQRVVYEYVRGERDSNEVAVGSENLEEPEPTLMEYDGALSFPFSKSALGEELVGQAPPTQCSANGIFCKCGFQHVDWEYSQLQGNQDCYNLKGTCQHCGLKDRVHQIGFDYKFLPPQHEDIYRLRTLKEGEIWNPPQYNYECKPGYVVTGVRSKYSRIDTLGGRDFYTLKIKCGKLKGEDDPNLRPDNWSLGEFPWLLGGEKPACEDLEEAKCKQATECEWKVHEKKCDGGNPFALEELIAKAKNNPGVEEALKNILHVQEVEERHEDDSTKPKPWSGGSRRRHLEDVDLDLAEDILHPELKYILSDFAMFVQNGDETKVSDVGEARGELDPFLAQVLQEFGDAMIDSSSSESESSDQKWESELGHSRDGEDQIDLDQLLDEIEYYERGDTHAAELQPVPVGDEFFDLDDQSIIQKFLETEVGSALLDDLKTEESSIQIPGVFSRWRQYFSLGAMAPIVDTGVVAGKKLEIWERLWQYKFGVSFAVLLAIVSLGCVSVNFCQKGDHIQKDYFLQSEEELEF